MSFRRSSSAFLKGVGLPLCEVVGRVAKCRPAYRVPIRQKKSRKLVNVREYRTDKRFSRKKFEYRHVNRDEKTNTWKKQKQITHERKTISNDAQYHIGTVPQKNYVVVNVTPSDPERIGEQCLRLLRSPGTREFTQQSNKRDTYTKYAMAKQLNAR